MKKEDCVIYKGKFFQIEWYFTEKGESQPFDYFNTTDLAQQRKFLMLCQRLGDFGKIMDKTKFRSEGDEIYAFKPQPDRYLAFFKKGKTFDSLFFLLPFKFSFAKNARNKTRASNSKIFTPKKTKA